MSEPLVTVVIPAYNAELYLADAILSACNTYQKHCPTEVLVVDDCSTDHTIKIAQKYADRVIHLSKNGGAANALNVGFSEASGQFVSWLSADDMFLGSQKSHIQVDAMERSNADWSYYMGCMRGNSLEVATKKYDIMYHWLHNNSRILRMLLTILSSPVNGSSVMIRKSSLKRYGLFDPKCGNVGADGNMWLRYTLYGAKHVAIKGYGVFYRTYDQSIHRPRKHFEDHYGRYREIENLRKLDSLPTGFESILRAFLKVTRL